MINDIVGRAEKGKYKVLHFDMGIIRKPWMGLRMPLCFTGARWLFYILLLLPSFFATNLFFSSERFLSAL